MNLYQGKILAEHFPFPLDRHAVDARLQALCREIAAATGRRYEPHELADGFLRVANAKMVQAIRTISIAKGADPRALSAGRLWRGGRPARLRRGPRTGHPPGPLLVPTPAC